LSRCLSSDSSSRALVSRAQSHGAKRRRQRPQVGPQLGLRYASRVDYRGIVTIEPGKRGGKPCIRGLRITVYDVLDYLASGMSEAEILTDFPDLTSDDVRACLAFAADRERRLSSVPAA